jgi:hypothetical protein
VADELDFEARVFGDYVASRDDTEFADRLARLGEELAAARGDYLTGRAATDVLVGETP